MKIMKMIWIYIFICLVWAIFSVYKSMTTHSIKGSFVNNLIVFLMNFVLFPLMFIIAIKKKKIFHIHNWVYYDYVPYRDKNHLHGAGYRKCKKCNVKQTNW